MENRWRYISGPNGNVMQGLDMSQAESIMRLSGIKRPDRARIANGLLAMEVFALAEIYA